MGKEVIMLANPFTPKKLEYPVIATEKLDGVAADFFGTVDGVSVRTRQDKPILSVQHILDWLNDKLPPAHHLICELYIPDETFKTISGMVRREENNPNIVAYVYDYYIEGSEHMDYKERMTLMAEYIGQYVVLKPDEPVQIIGGMKLNNLEDVEDYIESFSKDNPYAEGLVIRNIHGQHSTYKFGRSWGMQKKKVQATADLVVCGFEEAIDKHGEPKGMVGRIQVEYNGAVIGSGPGKLTHAERVEIFNNQDKYIGQIAEIAYMPDREYEALREPRFYRWRPDKDKPNQE